MKMHYITQAGQIRVICGANQGVRLRSRVAKTTDLGAVTCARCAAMARADMAKAETTAAPATAWSVSYALAKYDPALTFAGTREEVVAQVEAIARARGYFDARVEAGTGPEGVVAYARLSQYDRRRRWLTISLTKA